MNAISQLNSKYNFSTNQKISLEKSILYRNDNHLDSHAKMGLQLPLTTIFGHAIDIVAFFLTESPYYAVWH